MVPEKGDFSRISPPGLLLRIAESELTGILYLKRGDTLKALHFNGGRLVWAISNSVDDKIERIIMEGKLVDELELQRLRQKKSGAALGKALVEKGLLTVEQLVECTRIQFKRILDDVFSWNRGGFQVIQSPPPENLFKMDMDMVSLVFTHVLEQVSMKTIHAHIPDPNVRLECSGNEEKIARFNLSQKKRDFLSLFNGRHSLESVLGRYAESHHDSLLKVVYFFILAGLLTLPGEPESAPVPEFQREETEPELPVIEDVDESESLPTLEEMEKPVEEDSIEVDPPETIVTLDVDDGGPEPEFYSFEKDDASEEIGMEAEPEPVEPIDVDTMLRNESPGKRQVNLLFLLVVAILVTAGVIFLLLMSGDEDTTLSQSIPPPSANRIRDVKKPAAGKIQKKRETEPEKNGETGPPATSEPRPSHEEKGPSPLELVRRGDFPRAAEIWRSRLPGVVRGFTILLETDCNPASIRIALKRIDDPGKLWLLPLQLNGRSCYRVLWGRFASAEEARRSLGELPRYFMKQKPPAKVFDLAEYN